MKVAACLNRMVARSCLRPYTARMSTSGGRRGSSRSQGHVSAPRATDAPSSPSTHFDERQVPTYTLPDVLASQAGVPVATAAGWPDRRAEILSLYREHVYGVPSTNGSLSAVSVDVLRIESWSGAHPVPHETQQRLVEVSGPGGRMPFHILSIYPRRLLCPVPAVVALNFRGNHTVYPDERVWLSDGWIPADVGVYDGRPGEDSRGVRCGRWPIDEIVSAGMALVVAYAGDFAPDDPQRVWDGAAWVAVPDEGGHWGALGAWAWGLSRLVDVCVDDTRVDERRILALGHSRLGKAALWATAQDERIAGAASNDSGCGGAAIFRRGFGETIEAITARFPHWFTPSFSDYAGHPEDLPVDQHFLLSAIAPRSVSVASAADDLWADPRGEYLSVYHAGPVYRMHGYETVASATPPPVGVTVGRRAAHRVRRGGHDLTREDWGFHLGHFLRNLG